MGRASIKEDKNIYQLTREELGLTREAASQLLECIPSERIERIENGKYAVRPDEVAVMAEKYCAPELCNHYCVHECEIGKRCVPELHMRELPQLVLLLISELDRANALMPRLIELAAAETLSSEQCGKLDATVKALVPLRELVESLVVRAHKLCLEEGGQE